MRWPSEPQRPPFAPPRSFHAPPIPPVSLSPACVVSPGCRVPALSPPSGSPGRVPSAASCCIRLPASRLCVCLFRKACCLAKLAVLRPSFLSSPSKSGVLSIGPPWSRSCSYGEYSGRAWRAARCGGGLPRTGNTPAALPHVAAGWTPYPHCARRFTWHKSAG